MSARKFILSLAVTFCTLQGLHVEGNVPNLLENIKYQFLAKAIDTEKEIQLLSNKIIHKVNKKANRVLSAVEDENQKQKIESMRLEVVEKVDERTAEAEECIRDIRDNIDSSLRGKMKINKITRIRNNAYKKLIYCKGAGKKWLNTILNEFKTDSTAALNKQSSQSSSGKKPTSSSSLNPKYPPTLQVSAKIVTEGKTSDSFDKKEKPDLGYDQMSESSQDYVGDESSEEIAEFGEDELRAPLQTGTIRNTKDVPK